MPFTLATPYVWLKNDHFAAANVATVDYSDVWPDSGTRGTDWADIGQDVEAYKSNLVRGRNAVQFCTGAAGNNPTSLTIGFVLGVFSSNSETLIEQDGVILLSHPSTDELTITLGGSEVISVTDGLLDIGGFNIERMVIVRFTEGVSNGTLDVWINGTKVIDAQATTTTSLPASSNQWEFGERDHYWVEMFMYESAISDDDVDYWFGHWAWESAFANSDWQDELPSGHPYENAGPTAVALSRLAGEFVLLMDGKKAIVRLKREISSENYGAWSEDGWTWDESAENFIAALTVTADSVEQTISRIIRQSTPRSDNPNAARIDPHVTDNDFDTNGNFVEWSIEFAQPIDMDAEVRWSITSGIVSEGGQSNGAVTNELITENRCLYKPNITDRLTPAARGCFVSKSGTLPKLPNVENSLTPTGTYAPGDTITIEDINGSSNLLIVMDLQLNTDDGHAGQILEIGDTNAGIFVYFPDDNTLEVVVGTQSTRMVIVRNVESTSTLIPFDVAVTLAIHIHGTQVDIYTDGVLQYTQNDVDPSGWNTTTSDGRFGSALSEGRFYDDVRPAIVAAANITLTELRLYSNPTLNIALGTKDWYNPGLAIRPVDFYSGKPWEADYTKYIYNGDAFSDMKNPGEINECALPELAYFLLQESQSFGFNRPEKHEFIAYKAGETWVHGTDYGGYETRPWANEYRWLVAGDGESLTKPALRFKYGTGGLVTFDMSALGINTFPMKSWVFIEERVFKVIGKGDSDDSAPYTVAAITGQSNKQWWLGGTFIQNTGTNGFGATNINSLQSSDAGNWGEWVIGEMCYDDVSLNNSRGACFATAGPSDKKVVKYVIHQHSYFGSKYNGGGFGNTQAHGNYAKGWIPYLFIDGGWIPEGPGGAFKMDTHIDATVEKVVGWQRKGGFGIHNNGSDGEPGEDTWQATTTRAIRQGRHNERVLCQDFYFGEMDDFCMDIISGVHCEIRRGMLSTLINQLGMNMLDVGTSADEGENGGDSWYSGWHGITMLGVTENLLRLSWQNDRTQTHSYGSHYCYWHKILATCHDPVNDYVMEVEPRNDPDDSTYNEVHAAGGITQFRISKSHFDGKVLDESTSDTTLDAMRASMTTGGNAITTTTQSGAVAFANVTLNTDPLLEYFNDAGYATYIDVEDAIINAWEAGWDTVPTALQIDQILSNMAARMKPTNLNAADYGGSLPGYPQPTSGPVNPGVARKRMSLSGLTVGLSKDKMGATSIYRR